MRPRSVVTSRAIARGCRYSRRSDSGHHNDWQRLGSRRLRGRRIDMLTGAELSASIDKLLALRKEIWQAFVDTFIMLGISTTVAIVIGGLFGVFLFLSSDRQFLQNKTLYGVLGAITNFMRAFPFVILMIAMSPFTKAIVGTGIGPIAASLVLAIAGSFYFARLVEQNLREVPRGIIEATESMGARPFTIIKVLLN